MQTLPLAAEQAVPATTPQQAEAAPRTELKDELRKMEWEPLLPVEIKLISWSIGLGVALLGILVWVSYTFFPAGH